MLCQAIIPQRRSPAAFFLIAQQTDPPPDHHHGFASLTASGCGAEFSSLWCCCSPENPAIKPAMSQKQIGQFASWP
jgi:hypothetical protein